MVMVYLVHSKIRHGLSKRHAVTRSARKKMSANVTHAICVIPLTVVVQCRYDFGAVHYSQVLK